MTATSMRAPTALPTSIRADLVLIPAAALAFIALGRVVAAMPNQLGILALVIACTTAASLWVNITRGPLLARWGAITLAMTSGLLLGFTDNPLAESAFASLAAAVLLMVMLTGRQQVRA